MLTAIAEKGDQGSAEARPRTRIVFEARWVAGEFEPSVDDHRRPEDNETDAPDWWKEER